MPKANWKHTHTNAINRRKAFIDYYFADAGFNATEAARLVGSPDDSAGQDGYRYLHEEGVQEEIKQRFEAMHMSADEALKGIAEIARGNLGDFYKVVEMWMFNPLPYCEILKEQEVTVKVNKQTIKRTQYLCRYVALDTDKLADPRYSHLLQEFSQTPRMTKVKLYSKVDAYDKVFRVSGKYKDTLNINNGGAQLATSFTISADKIAPSFASVYRDIVQKQHTEYIFKGGRGSAKSSFVSETFIYLLVNNPQMHGLALRQVADTLRDSVYAQLQWATGILGLSDQFKCTLSPMEIEYLPTGQKIFFRGADDPGKIKSITPTFGYIGIVWFEELDQFHGQNAIRTIEQSIRGGDDIYHFKSFNPPPTKGNWANKYLEIPKDTQYQHHSNYLGLPQSYLEDEELRKAIPLEEMIQAYKSLAVPSEWLGRTWLDDAEHLKETNLKAYENEYLGIATNDGGMIFDNIVIREITDDEISQFDNVLRGLDWGYYPDPASFGVMHFDAARRTLYIYGEGRYWKKSNQDLFNALVEDGLITKTEYTEKKKKIVSYPDLMIADSAEPKSVGDFRAYGANVRGAEKGPESRKYSYKWLQGLKAIIIDNKRAPYHAEEFLNAEFERTKDGEIISEYPQVNDHAIDDVRYGCNRIWMRRGE